MTDCPALALRTMPESSTSAAAAISARSAAPRHVGGWSAFVMRCSLARAASPALPLFSAAVGLRPVRPRDSTTPAALPRCLVWRLRLVWAMHGAYSDGAGATHEG